MKCALMGIWNPSYWCRCIRRMAACRNTEWWLV